MDDEQRKMTKIDTETLIFALLHHLMHEGRSMRRDALCDELAMISSAEGSKVPSFDVVAASTDWDRCIDITQKRGLVTVIGDQVTYVRPRLVNQATTEERNARTQKRIRSKPAQGGLF